MKKLCLTVSIMFIFILNFAVISNAASANLNASLNTEQVEQGKEVLVAVKIEDIQGVQRGFNALTGVLEYDDNIFETVQNENFKMQNGWDDIIYNPSNKMFATAKGEGIKTNETIFELTLKTKADVETGDYTIKLKDFTVSEGIEDIILGEKDITVTIIENTNKDDNLQENINDNVENNAEDNTKNQTNLTLYQKNTGSKVNSATDQIAQANAIWIVVTVCVIVIAIVVIAYIIKKKREKSDL